MKIHITNLYNFNQNDPLVAMHHHFAEVGRSLGFLEMGIFSYPVETDTLSELHKRLDGIIASLEADDLVILQLPTQNGFTYEQLLFDKIKAYPNTKIILLLHNLDNLFPVNNELEERYLSLYKKADAIIAPTAADRKKLTDLGLHSLLFCDNVISAQSISKTTVVSNSLYTLCHNDFYTKKLLLDAVELATTQGQLLSSIAIDDEIHIGFGLHDKTGNYSVWVGVAMQSIIEHTGSKLCFHILHDETLNYENTSRLTHIATTNGHRIIFHPLDKSLFSEIEQRMGIYTIGAMFHIALPELLPELSKIIYLDADILVARDIKELWDTNINDYYLAAVPDSGVVNGSEIPSIVRANLVSAERYFNSGVLFMNLSLIREKGNMRTDIMNYLKASNNYAFPDQDALNVIYNSKTYLLDGSWNYFAKNVRRDGEKQLQKKIYHYVGTLCTLYCLTDMDLLYYETLSRTPWGMEECRKHLNNSLYRITDRLTLLEKIIKKLSSSHRKRIFYGPESMAMKHMYQLIPVQPGDYRISKNPSQENDCILPCFDISIINQEANDSYLIFLLPDADNGKAIENLEQLGLKNEVDFFVIPRLLPPWQGGFL